MMAEILDLVDLDELRHQVREKYRDVAADPIGTQHPHHFHTGRAHAARLGYPTHPLSDLPEEACEAFAGVGNPFYWGGPKPGERVIDLGSGAGMDSFLAALWVGSEGRVIGVDMTPEMVERSRLMAEKLGLKNVEFREGLIEDLPVEDGWADVVIVASGKVQGKTAERHTSSEFVAFLASLVAEQPADREVHIILDNLSAHKTKLVNEFVGRHANVRLHFTPTYSSWLNQVELWLNKLERQVIARGIFKSTTDLAKKLMLYIREHNKTAQPIRSKYSDPSRRMRNPLSSVTAH
jgi:transposase